MGRIEVTVFNADARTRLRTSPFVHDVERVLRHYDRKSANISVIFSSRSDHREMNRQFLGHDYDTDVITFPLEESPLEGEIYVNVAIGREQAREHGVPFYHEMRRLVVHGTLHLLGFDDQTDEEREEMRRLENQFLERGSRSAR